ncbi:MAG: hypothetical protein U1E06_21700 [Tabrizicola sp.]|uniref:hypothetical protein n=1 Tax=Tabrizicola sp. TaxID=2005166 RepID=UPI002736169A|nr:hypothetical protein [Tabrizicola sp.]MDP3263604.1 hypothetical protein [Tabrizicola sp.]MDP3646968.1 hypothetical protein [Paracoccaceae bacterium]MDZ4069420.1 hypothetical protein [Tabrizicola sp.]
MALAAPQTTFDPRQIVADSLAHLVRLVRPDGRFVYAHPAGDPDTPLEGYNMLRHCGTLWFMLRAVNDMGLDPGATGFRAIERAAAHAGRKLQRPGWIAAPSLALVTKDAIKTGGIGLMLVMLAEYRRALPKGLSSDVMPEPLDDTITALQTYALAQIEGGDFLHKRRIDDGTVLPFRSDYYTGEVILGLLVTGCTDPAMVAVAEGLMARGYGIPEHSHWMAYAACEAAERGLGDPLTVRRYLGALMRAITTETGYHARRASTPIACRAEALTRVLLLGDRRPGLFDADLLAACLHAAETNLELQLGWYADGQFWKGDGDEKVQIDYIQHNATAFLNLWQYLSAQD